MLETLKLGTAEVLWSGRAEGHLGHNPPRRAHDEFCCGPELDARRALLRPTPWHHLTQMHGNSVAVAPEADRGSEADAVITCRAGITLAIATADCAPIALSAPEGVIGAVHAGWKGLEAGVLVEAARGMRSLGAAHIQAALGPCIHVECYEFGEDSLDAFTNRWGSGVRGVTSAGTPAFDLPAAVEAECDAAGVALVHVEDACTACDERYFSYRARAEDARQVMLVWR